LLVVDVHEVGEHAEGWDLRGGVSASLMARGRGGRRSWDGKERAYESDYLHEAPEGEEES
jgi:hypothetical protein